MHYLILPNDHFDSNIFAIRKKKSGSKIDDFHLIFFYVRWVFLPHRCSFSVINGHTPYVIVYHLFMWIYYHGQASGMQLFYIVIDIHCCIYKTYVRLRFLLIIFCLKKDVLQQYSLSSQLLCYSHCFVPFSLPLNDFGPRKKSLFRNLIEGNDSLLFLLNLCKIMKCTTAQLHRTCQKKKNEKD